MGRRLDRRARKTLRHFRRVEARSRTAAGIRAAEGAQAAVEQAQRAVAFGEVEAVAPKHAEEVGA